MWSHKIRKLRVQSDSAIAVKLLSDSQPASHQHLILVWRFQELKARQWDVSIEHIYREANFAADFLANSGHELELGTSIFSSPCISLLEWLRYDLLNVCLPRQVNNIP
ncbi:Putative ribonuclease H protein At1g65750 [Linum perenne]